MVVGDIGSIELEEPECGSAGGGWTERPPSTPACKQHRALQFQIRPLVFVQAHQKKGRDNCCVWCGLPELGRSLENKAQRL